MGANSSRSDLPDPEVIKSEEEWKKELPGNAYYILRKAGTEPAFTGRYWNNHQEGTYVCRGCQNPLFSSSTKFESGTGWPSFYKALSESESVVERADYKFGYRVEILCKRCHGHLGHVFPDGPEPTGMRYCMNSGAMDFKSK
ncbi:hypothetical protein HDU97_007117 [Phlyctochytrium planicorne]|nr:hypothetical protein HDU97_007117 [Phlyctochytrium planicorne]